MKKHDRIVAVVREWVEKAEEDFAVAVFLVGKSGSCPAAVVCFHAQQAIEKYLKAALVAGEIAFPKTHKIKQIMALMPPRERPVLSGRDQDRLTDYATVTRYPGAYDPITLSEARRAVALARRVRSEMRKHLPKESLRRKGK